LLTGILREDDAVEVLGTASNGTIALQRIEQLNPDVVTLDIEMPEMDGLATLTEIRRRFPATRVIMVSSLTERGTSMTLDALANGADDYLSKGALQENGTTSGSSPANFLQQQLLQKVKQFSRTIPSLPPSVREERHEGEFSPEIEPAELFAPVLFPVRRPSPRAIVIGVSTGGPNALAELIPALPPNLSVPVFIVQHMPPMFTRLLADRLQTQSGLRVLEAADATIAKPGHVYIAPGDYHMAVVRTGSEAVVRLNHGPLENSCRPAADVLFRTASECYDGAVIAVVLTGMGQDGLRGSARIRSMGGHVVAQDEETSVVWGMPGLVVRAGLADAVCGIKSIAAEILRRI